MGQGQVLRNLQPARPLAGAGRRGRPAKPGSAPVHQRCATSEQQHRQHDLRRRPHRLVPEPGHGARARRRGEHRNPARCGNGAARQAVPAQGRRDGVGDRRAGQPAAGAGPGMSTAVGRRAAAPRRLGSSRVEVSALSLGCAAFGNLYTEVSDEASTQTLRTALDLGVRYADVAPFYGFGLAEQRVGAALAGVPRADFVLSTKVGRLLRPGAGPALDAVFDFTADGILRSVEESLTRLGLDRVDILYIHDPDEHLEQAITEAYPAAHQLRAEGVVGAIGAGMNFSAPLTRFVRETDIDAVL